MKNINLVALALVTSTLGACGGQAYRQPDGLATGQQAVNNFFGSGSGTSGTGTTTNNGSYTPAISPPDFDIYGTIGKVADGQTVGPSEVSFAPVSTDNTLRVRVRALPGSASMNNASYQYSCVRFTVSISSGQSMVTGLIKVPGATGYCPNGADYQDLDFSGYMTAGHGAITVTVKNANTDMYCQWQSWGLIPYAGIQYCPVSPAHKMHKTSARIQIQVNGTQFN